VEVVLEEPRAQYADLVNLVLDGDGVEVRGLRTRERTGVTLVLPDVRRPVLPVGTGHGINTRFAAVETLSVVAGVFDEPLTDAAAPGWRRVLVDPSRPEVTAYGPRLHSGMDDVAGLLRKDPTSRQAVAAVWRPTDLLRTGDKPCTLFLQFLQRRGALDLYVSMRSQDVWLGVPYDLFMFTQLLLTMAAWLGVTAGRLVHHVTSLHLYERDLEATERLHNPPKELKENLPLGVIVPEEASAHADRPSLVAKDLLLSRPYRRAAEANPWYAARVRETVERMRDPSDA